LVSKLPEFSCKKQNKQYKKFLQEQSCNAHMFTCHAVVLPHTINNAVIQYHAGTITAEANWIYHITVNPKSFTHQSAMLLRKTFTQEPKWKHVFILYGFLWEFFSCNQQIHIRGISHTLYMPDNANNQEFPVSNIS
jgi:hypothetical protein